MRIREVVADLTSAKDMINEAVRFGNKEKMEVIKKSNDFRIGIEYEFEVDERYLSGYNDPDVEPTEEDIEREMDAIMSYPPFKKLINEMSSLIAGMVDYLPMETLLNARDENPNQPVESDFYQNLLSNIEEMQADDVFEHAIDIINFERDNRIVSFFELFSEAIEEYYGTGFASFKYQQGTREAAMYLKKLNEITEENKLKVLAAVKTFSDGFYDVFDDLEDHFMGKTAADVARTLKRDIASTSRLEEIATNNARDHLETFDYYDSAPDLNEQAVSYVESEIPSHMRRYIEKIEEDSSLSHGAEVVTDPLTLADTFDFMEDMFAFIQKHGYTDNGCGMHVNISHRLMGKEVRLNPLRILTLLDPDFFQNRTVNRKLDKYEERHKYAQSFGSILAREDILGALVGWYVTEGVDGLERYLSFYLVQAEKYRAINFTALFNVYQPDRRRIEVRLFGGKDYEKRFVEIQHDIYNLCYVIQAMVDPDFKKREHLEGMFRLLNRAAARYDRNQRTTFMDLVSRYRKTGRISE